VNKRFIMVGLILSLMFLLIYTNRNELYRYARNILKDTNEETVRKEIRDSEGVWGIDISHHQKKINWDELVEYNKPDFIFLKSTEGTTHQDSKYKVYKNEAEKSEILVGAYHFFSYQSPGKSQAKNFISNSNLKEGDLLPVLDLEYVKNVKKYKNKLGEIKDFCSEIKAEFGVYPIIYCECDYRKRVLDSFFDDFTFWISDLYGEPKCDYVFWQYTDRGEVRGIGRIDNNKLRDDLNIQDYLIFSKGNEKSELKPEVISGFQDVN
jgi:lysozyme